MHDHGNHHEPHTQHGASKSQKKRDMTALQELGEQLVKLSADRLTKMDLPEALREAVREAQRMSGRNEAMRRQMQYIGRLMREADAGPIRAELDKVNGVSKAEVARLHRLERMRERFIEDEKVATEIVATWPEADIQHLRQLRRNAIKEHADNKPPRAFREIFRILKALDDALQAGPGEDEAEVPHE